MMINIAVEGESDREAAKAVVRSAGRDVARVAVAGGKSRLDPKILKYNEAARSSSWVVFRDSDGICPATLRQRLLPSSSRRATFQLRIAHSMTEAWLLADRNGFSDFFHVRLSQVPANPEDLAHAKRSLLNLCSTSRLQALRRDMVTANGQTGPLYVVRLNEFAATTWDVSKAAINSPSLARAIAAIGSLA